MNTHKEIFNYRTPVIVFSALILLTLLTVATSSLALGETGSIMLAMFIASVKGSLVLIFFMHLNHEPLIFKLFVALAFVTLATLFVLTFADYAFRGVS
jgi:cytochrome c oxidase subunit 4